MKNQFLSESKSDWERLSINILDGKICIAQNDIPYLLEWLQDVNWPGANNIIQFLLSHEELCIESIKQALKSDDDIWKFNILHYLVSKLSEKRIRELGDQLLSLAILQDHEDVHLSALEICVKNLLVKPAILSKIIESKIENDHVNIQDYIELRTLLNDLQT